MFSSVCGFTLRTLHLLSEDSPYDLVVDINNICNISNGWKVLISMRYQNQEKINYFDVKSPKNLVAILGQFNHGKTYILGNITSEKLEQGYMVSTKGISMKRSTVASSQNFISIDTQGSDSCVEYELLYERRATDAFLRELALHLSTIAIVVVNRLRRSDQVYINGLVKGFCDGKGLTRQLFVVHNFVQTEDPCEVDELIKEEICGVFQATKESSSIEGKEVVYWRSTMTTDTYNQQNVTILHFVIAKGGSAAGDVWNQQTFLFMRTLIDLSVKTRRPSNLIDEIVDFTNEKLSSYVRIPKDFPQVIFNVEEGLITLNQITGGRDFTEPINRLELLDLTFDDSGTIISPGNAALPVYNLVEAEDWYDLHLNMAGTRERNEENPRAEVRVTPHGIEITTTRHIPPKYDIKGRFLRQDMMYGKVILSESFPSRVDTIKPREVTKVGDMWYIRYFKEKLKPEVEVWD
jgi:GTPase SAR1 family protein